MGETFRKNVIVVGAGASKEYGLPTGVELAGKIAQLADIRFDYGGREMASGDYQIVDTLRTLAKKKNTNQGINPYLHAAWRIRDNMGLAPSIDNFLDTHRNDEFLVAFGKIAICHSIQVAESKSKLFVDSSQGSHLLKTAGIRETWLVQLFKLLVAQRNYEDFLVALSQITFVSFNYDRCIHQFFYFACTSYFNLDREGQERLLSALTILYPYGTIGAFSAAESRTSFGIMNYRDQLIEASDQIRTFTEGAESNLVDQIRQAIGEAEIVMFLGFGFLQLNMDLLFQNGVFPPIRVIGTGKGLSKDSISEVELELSEIFWHRPALSGIMLPDDPNRIKILDCTCGELFFEFQRYLTRSR